MIKYVALFLLLAINGSRSTADEGVLTVDRARLIRLIGTVNFNMLKKANDITKLADSSSKNIYLLFNSPGGSIAVGEVIIESIRYAKHKNVSVICLSSINAMSMAFTIMLHCNQRYVLSSTRMLFHPARVSWLGSSITAPTADDISERLKKYDIETIKLISDKLDWTPEFTSKHYYRETMWRGKDLAKLTRFFKVVNVILNVPDLFLTK